MAAAGFQAKVPSHPDPTPTPHTIAGPEPEAAPEQPESSPANDAAVAAANVGKSAADVDQPVHDIHSNGAEGGCNGDSEDIREAGAVDGDSGLGSYSGGKDHDGVECSVHDPASGGSFNASGLNVDGLVDSYGGAASDGVGDPLVKLEPVSTSEWRPDAPLSPTTMAPFHIWHANEQAKKAAEKAAKRARRAAQKARGEGHSRAGKRAIAAVNQTGQQASGQQHSSAAQQADAFLAGIAGECMAVLHTQCCFSCLRSKYIPTIFQLADSAGKLIVANGSYITLVVTIKSCLKLQAHHLYMQLAFLLVARCVVDHIFAYCIELSTCGATFAHQLLPAQDDIN